MRLRIIAEKLFVPVALDILNIMIGESAGKLFSKVPLFINTVSLRIHRIADDINDQLIKRKKRHLVYSWMRLWILIMMFIRYSIHG